MAKLGLAAEAEVYLVEGVNDVLNEAGSNHNAQSEF
jgi:hypothetical protein